MNRETKGPPGGAWYLPAVEVFWSRKPLCPVRKPAPLPKDIAELYDLVSRYSEALQLEKDTHCRFVPQCGAFHDQLEARGLKGTMFDHLTPAQLERFQQQALILLLKYLP